MKIIIIIISLFLISCTEINYQKNKKIVIRKIDKITREKEADEILIINVNFDFDKWNLKKEEKKKLDSFINYIDGLKGNLIIIGHTDIIGTDKYNDILSLKRAISVNNYLKKRVNLKDYKITIKGKGKKALLNKKRNLKAMAENRRVEITFILK